MTEMQTFAKLTLFCLYFSISWVNTFSCSALKTSCLKSLHCWGSSCAVGLPLRNTTIISVLLLGVINQLLWIIYQHRGGERFKGSTQRMESSHLFVSPLVCIASHRSLPWSLYVPISLHITSLFLFVAVFRLESFCLLQHKYTHKIVLFLVFLVVQCEQGSYRAKLWFGMYQSMALL